MDRVIRLLSLVVVAGAISATTSPDPPLGDYRQGWYYSAGLMLADMKASGDKEGAEARNWVRVRNLLRKHGRPVPEGIDRTAAEYERWERFTNGKR